jgi:hypothetical protein
MRRVPAGCIPRDRIQAVIRKRTGVLVTEQRIGGWITAGELRMLKVPSGRGYKWYSTPEWIDDLIRRHS